MSMDGDYTDALYDSVQRLKAEASDLRSQLSERDKRVEELEGFCHRIKGLDDKFNYRASLLHEMADEALKGGR
jgi:hypothetical protein